MAMNSSAKLIAGVVVVTATLVAIRSFDTGRSDGVDRTGRTAVRIESGPRGDGGTGLVDVTDTTQREDLVEVIAADVTAPPTEDLTADDDAAPAVSTVRARLVDESEAPLEGAVLRSIYSDGRPRGESCWSAADANGVVEIEIEDSFMRAYKTEVFPMAFQAAARMHATVFVLSTPRWHGITDLGTITLAPGGAIEGRLVDDAGRGVEGGRVYVGEAVLVGEADALRLKGPDTGLRRPRADTGASGRFEFTGAATGAFRLYAGAEGTLWTITDPFELTAGVTIDVGSIVLDPVPAEELIVGRVVRPDGGPAAGAMVAYESMALRADGTLTADDSGRFSFNPGGPGDVDFVARDANDDFGMSASRLASRGTDDLVLELTEKRVIVVTVVDDGGDPVAEASLMPFLTDRDYFGNGGRPIPGADWIRSDESGVALVPVPSGEFTFGVNKSGHESRRLGPYQPESAPGSATVTLKREPHVAGRVLAYGQPVAGAKIKIAQRIEGFVPLEAGFPIRFFSNQSHGIESDADGRFACPVDSEWTDITVLAASGRFATGETELTVEPGAGAEKVVVELTDGGSIAGAVLAPAGYEPRELYVAASRGDGDPVWVRVSEDSTYVLEGLTPGPWRVEGRLREPSAAVLSVAQDPEDKEFNWNAEVVDREKSRFDVDMRGMGNVEIHGRLLIDGEPARGWRVKAEPEDEAYTGTMARAAELDDSGSFVLDVPAGACAVTLVGGREGAARIEVRRALMLEGSRVDWEEALVTGPVAETLEPGVEEVRVLRGVSSRGDCELTYFEPDAEGRIQGRAIAGEGHIQSPLTLDIGRLWANVRPIEVRAR